MLILWALFVSCNAQNASNDIRTNLDVQELSVSKGNIVTELDKSIMVVFQDKKDNFWFGSKDQGVYKYDGKNLILYTTKEGLCNKSILGIQEDQFGNLYFDTPTGVSKFDGEQFTTLAVIDSNSSKNEWQLEPDDLWFRMGWDKSGPYRYDGKALYHLEFPRTNQEEAFYSKYPNVPFNPYGIYTMYKDRRGALWFGTASLGVCRYDGKTVSWLYERHLTETPNGGDFGFRSIIEDKDGYFWFCNTRYRYEILPSNTEVIGTNLINYRKENGIGTSIHNNEKDFPYFLSIAEDNSGDLWMVTYDDGVWRKNEEKLIHYPVKDGETAVLLFSVYKDNLGTLWLGTHNAGAFKFNGRSFEKFKP